MGKITLMVEGNTVGTVANGGGIVIEKTVSDQDSTRLITAYAITYAGRWTDANNNPRMPTPEEVIYAWFDSIVEGSVGHVLSVEKEQAAKQAALAVEPIVVANG